MHLPSVRKLIGLIPVGDSHFFFFLCLCYIDQFTFHISLPSLKFGLESHFYLISIENQRSVYASYLEEVKILYPLQFGFREKCSNTNALVSITESIRQSIDNNEFGCGMFIDIKKAFDTVNHRNYPIN